MSARAKGAVASGVVAFLVCSALVHFGAEQSATKSLQVGLFWGVVAFGFAYKALPEAREEAKPAPQQVVPPNKEERNVEDAIAELDTFRSQDFSRPSRSETSYPLEHGGNGVLKVHLSDDSEPLIYFTLDQEVLPVLVVTRKSRVRWKHSVEETVGPWIWCLSDESLAQTFEKTDPRGLEYEVVCSAHGADLEQTWRLEVREDHMLIHYASHFDNSP